MTCGIISKRLHQNRLQSKWFPLDRGDHDIMVLMGPAFASISQRPRRLVVGGFDLGSNRLILNEFLLVRPGSEACIPI